MATKEVALIPAEECNVTFSDGAMYAYKFAIAHAGIEMDEGANVFAKVCGLTQDKFMDLFPEFVCAKAKERTLSIK